MNPLSSSSTCLLRNLKSSTNLILTQNIDEYSTTEVQVGEVPALSPGSEPLTTVQLSRAGVVTSVVTKRISQSNHQI